MSLKTRDESADRVASRWDAVVIGAGPAGAMAARELAMAGASVLLIEKQAFPMEKVCGGCLNGHALGVLRAAGLEAVVRDVGGVPLSSFRVGVRGRSFSLDLPAGMAVPRGRFDEALVGAAVAAGVRFLPRTEARVATLDAEGATVRLGTAAEAPVVHAHVILVAAGRATVALPDGSGVAVRVARGSRIGTGCTLDDGPAGYGPGTIHMAVGRAGYVGLVRQADGRWHVAAAIGPREMPRLGGPGPAAEAILREAGLPPVPDLRTARWRGTTPLTRRAHPIAATRMFLLGDAAGYVEPFTGEGIAWGLSAGRAVAPLAMRAIDRWEPALAREWGRLHGRVVGRRQVACRIAAGLLRRPVLMQAALVTMNRLPAARERLLGSLNAPPHLAGAR